MYTTDPRLVSSAKPISEITFDEAAELMQVHPATIKPAMEVVLECVADSKRPELPGTIIVNKTIKEPGMGNITTKRSDSTYRS